MIEYLVLHAIGEEREMKAYGISLSIHLTELPWERSDILAGRHESQPQLHADH
jgi:hypothetical protein